MRFRWSIETKLILSLVYAFYFVLAGAVGSYQSSRAVIDASRNVENSMAFTGSMQALLPAAKQLDRLARTPSSAASPEIQGKWEQHVTEINAELAKLEATAQGDTRRVGLLKPIQDALANLIAVDRNLVYGSGSSAAPATIKGLGRQSEAQLSSLHEQIQAAEADESKVLKSQISEYQADADNVLMRHYLFSLLVLAFLVSLGITLYHYVTVMRRAVTAERRIAQDIVEHAPIGILKLSKDNVVSEVNPVFCKYTGKPADEIIGKRAVDVIPALSESALVEAADNQIAKQIEDLVVVIDKGDPDLERHWDVTVWPVLDENEGIKGMILLIVDVTEKLSLANQREVFAQTLTHDMKTPLIAADRIYEAILSDRVGKLDSAQFDLLSKLRRNNFDVLKMVKDVLEISKYKDKKPILNPESIALGEIIEETVAKLIPTSDARQVRVVTELGENPVYAKADKVALKHLIHNLVENAIKFSPAGETVQVRAEKQGESAFISVTDHGGGIPAEDQKKLFKGSWQGDLGKTAPSGTGLGLYLCHQIVLAHRGDITVKSSRDEGTTFTVELPSPPISRAETAEKAESGEAEVAETALVEGEVGGGGQPVAENNHVKIDEAPVSQANVPYN